MASASWPSVGRLEERWRADEPGGARGAGSAFAELADLCFGGGGGTRGFARGAGSCGGPAAELAGGVGAEAGGTGDGGWTKPAAFAVGVASSPARGAR